MSLARPKPKREQDRACRAWINTLPCIACAVEGRVTHGCDCAHVSFLGEKGFGSKVSDYLTVPLCREHHTEQGEKRNERVWWARLGIKPARLTAALRTAYESCAADGAADATIRLFAAEAARAPRLVAASRLADRTEPQDAAPPAVTLEAHQGAGRDEHGNVSVVLPVLTARGRSTVHAWADPSCLRPTGGEG